MPADWIPSGVKRAVKVLPSLDKAAFQSSMRAPPLRLEDIAAGEPEFGGHPPEMEPLYKLAHEVSQNPTGAPLPEGLRPGVAGPVLIGQVFERHRERKKLGNLRPDRLLMRLGEHLREVSGNAQHWILDNLGLLVEKGMPAMIVLCHFPFMSKWVRSEEGDVDADANGQQRRGEADAPPPPSGAPMIGP